jgi:hypothetical protein
MQTVLVNFYKHFLSRENESKELCKFKSYRDFLLRYKLYEGQNLKPFLLITS